MLLSEIQLCLLSRDKAIALYASWNLNIWLAFLDMILVKSSERVLLQKLNILKENKLEVNHKINELNSKISDRHRP